MSDRPSATAEGTPGAEPRLPDLSYVRAGDGTRIAWTRLGSGPTLVVVPPVPFSNVVGDWGVPLMRRVYGRLAAVFELILYDGRGTGASQRDVEDLGTDALAYDLEVVLDAAGADRVALLAMYLACPPALAFAARHPQRTSHLVLFGGSGEGGKQLDRPGTAALIGLIDDDWELFTTTAAIDWMGWSAGEAGALVARSFRDTTTPAIAKRALAAFAASDPSTILPRVTAPALVLHRRSGRQIELETSASLAAALPHGRLRVLEGESATLFFDDPDGTVDVIRDFVRPGHPHPAADQSVSVGGSTTDDGPPDPGLTVPLAPLTEREREVLALIAGGESNAEIAHQLGLSIHTVERHAANIYRKIDARGRADATAWALRNGVA